MNTIKKLTPKILYLLLLTIIAVLFFVEIRHGEVVIPDTSLDNTDVPSTPSDNLDFTSKDETIDTNLPDLSTPSNDEVKTTYNDTIPRQPLASESHLYTQRIYGDDSIKLQNVISTSKGLLAILSSNASSGDVCGKLPSIGVVIIDIAGNIQNAISLSYSYTYRYVASNVIADGIIIISTSKNNDYLYINKISIELTEITTYRIPYADTAEIVSVGSSFLVFAKYSNETIVYKPHDNSFMFQRINGGDVVEIFDFNNYFLIFCNNSTNNSYSIVKLNTNSLSLSFESSIINSQLISVVPIIENGSQYFIVLSMQNNMIVATKLDYTLNNALITKNLGYSNISKVLAINDKLMFFSQGNINGVVSLNYDLSTDLNQSDCYNTLLNIYEVNYFKETFYCLAKSKNNELVMIRTKNNVSTVEYYSVDTTHAKFCINPNNTLSIFYQDNKEVKIIGTQQ